MPSLQNKAILLKLSVDLAENNVRKNILSFNVGVQGQNNNVVEQSLILQPGEVVNFPVITGNSLTLARCLDGALAVAASNTQGLLNFTLNSLLVLTDNVLSLSFTNPGSTPVQLYVTQT